MYFYLHFHLQQLRKGILEILHRFPSNEQLRPHAKNILNLVFKLVETDNEENVLICLRIVIELHKQFRPPFTSEVQQFLNFVKLVYTELPGHMDKIFDPNLRGPIVVGEISQLNVTQALEERFSATPIHSDKRTAENNPTFTVCNNTLFFTKKLYVQFLIVLHFVSLVHFTTKG
jgi:transformation/transcription domain-associated protein